MNLDVYKLGENVGPRVYESMHYFRENKFNKRCLTPLDAAKFIVNSVWMFLFDKQN